MVGQGEPPDASTVDAPTQMTPVTKDTEPTHLMRVFQHCSLDVKSKLRLLRDCRQESVDIAFELSVQDLGCDNAENFDAA